MKKLLMAAFLLTSFVAHAEVHCGRWIHDVNIDPITDTAIHYAFVNSDQFDGALGFRCGPGKELAFVTTRLIITESDFIGTYSKITIRVDKRTPVTLTFYKANTNLWIHNADESTMRTLFLQVRNGSRIAVRVHEPNSYEDYSFTAIGFTQCSEMLPCW